LTLFAQKVPQPFCDNTLVCFVVYKNKQMLIVFMLTTLYLDGPL